jgi:hypothetical protein
MNIRPPDMRQNDAMSSDGGLDGRIEDGGDKYITIYEMARARAKPTRRVPHYSRISTKTKDLNTGYVTRLFMNHGRYVRTLVMRAHHQA